MKKVMILMFSDLKSCHSVKEIMGKWQIGSSKVEKFVKKQVNSLGNPSLGSLKVEKFVKEQGNSLGIPILIMEKMANLVT